MRPPKAGGPTEQPIPQKSLEEAEALLAGDDLEAAATELHELIEAYPSSPQAPQALFQLAVLYLAPDSPLHDASQGIALLRNLVSAYPSSSWSLPSDTILKLAGTNADLRQVAAGLQDQLDRLKEIDIGSDG